MAGEAGAGPFKSTKGRSTDSPSDSPTSAWPLKGQLAGLGAPAQLGLDGAAYAPLPVPKLHPSEPERDPHERPDAQQVAFLGELFDYSPQVGPDGEPLRDENRKLVRTAMQEGMRSRLTAARREVRKGKPPMAEVPVEHCEPEKWVVRSCDNGHANGAVPADGCGRVNCEVCAPRVTGRRRRKAIDRMKDAPILRAIVPYPAELRERISRDVARAMGSALYFVVEQWLRRVHFLPDQAELGGEDWLHPVGEEGGFHPHHNLLVRGQALWHAPDGTLMRRQLAGYVAPAWVEALKLAVREVYLFVFGESPPVPVVYYDYRGRFDPPAKRAHFVGYTARGFPGWHAKNFERCRAGYGYFQRGWATYREQLGLDAREPRECWCGAGLVVYEVDTADAREFIYEHGLDPPPGLLSSD